MLFLQLIRRGRWSLYALCDSCGDCPLEEFLADTRQLGKDKDRMLRRLEAIADLGPDYLPDISHQIEGEIWQTEQGRIRILWFYEKGRMIICSHGFIKRTEKTPEREKAAARQALASYRAAQKAGAIIFFEE